MRSRLLVALLALATSAIAISALSTSALANSASAISVEEAYRIIPHQRTVFLASAAQMPPAEKAHLTALFSLIDQAIVAKVSASRGADVAQAYAPFWKAWASLKPPASLHAVQDRVKAAITDQQAFLVELQSKRTNWNMNHPKVRAASGTLQRAYGDLMGLYPNENATNKQAFFDYLCALDFI